MAAQREAGDPYKAVEKVLAGAVNKVLSQMQRRSSPRSSGHSLSYSSDYLPSHSSGPPPEFPSPCFDYNSAK